MPPQPARNEPRQLRAMDQHHAPEQFGLNAPGETREAASEQTRHGTGRGEPPALAEGEEGRGAD